MKTHFYADDETSDLSRDKECSEPAPLAPLCYQKHLWANFHSEEEKTREGLWVWLQWRRERNTWSGMDSFQKDIKNFQCV